MKNWRTTLAGALYTAATVAWQAYQSSQGVAVDWKQVGVAAAIAALAYLAKDAGVSGAEK